MKTLLTIKLLLITICLSLLIACSSAQQNDTLNERVSYTLGPVFEGSVLKALAITVNLSGDADGETELRFPDAWAGQEALYNGIVEFAALDPRVKLERGKNPLEDIRQIKMNYKWLQSKTKNILKSSSNCTTQTW